ncbi:uncharacterized protein OCT59_004715 [Rhizophagus irregularis]|uniref:uncharacterized protein n=1 Tax=Rhizophagus irregularis TaxID=588596 RepID=UPI003325607E|nr:hypothetical protein OCT59_004715 [Rhizophagus irregularis]
MNKESETQVPIESVFNNLNISNNSKIINHKNCYNEKFKRPWCKECVPSCIIEGWTSENHDIDEFIKDTIYDSRLRYIDTNYYPLFLEWVPYDKFEDIKQIGVGGFAKVYSATWIDGQVKYKRQDDGSWKKVNSEPIKVALKMLNGSQNMSDEYLNELKTHWKLNKSYKSLLTFYGMTKDPETKEFIMITQFAEKGNLRSFLSNFGLSGSSNEQKSDNKICGVLPYIAPEVLNGEPYTLSSDIYSFGVIMAELSSGKPPFHKRKHDATLALAICNGLRPEFGKGTPEVYKKLAYSCMNSTPNQRPTANDLSGILIFWYDCIHNESYKEREKFGYKVKDIKAMFEEANKEIPNISTSYEMDSDAAYTSRVFTFNNLSKSNNSPIVTSYSNSSEENDKDCQDSQLFDLEIS